MASRVWALIAVKVPVCQQLFWPGIDIEFHSTNVFDNRDELIAQRPFCK